jgi:phosphoribosylanthranilate isomerase
MKTKICGIRTTEMLQACVDSNVAFLGFNFVPTSRRCVTSEFLNQLTPSPKHSQYVGVFQNQSLEEVKSLATKYNLDFVQLHGQESLAFIQELSQRVIKGISLQKKHDIEVVMQYLGHVKIILLDGPLPGKGKAAETALLEEAVQLCRASNQAYAIAGGIGEDNVEALLERYPDAHFFDTASAIEDQHGHFSETKLTSLLTKIS